MQMITQPDSDTQGLSAFSQENLAAVYHFVYVQVKNQEVAEDLTAQVFLKAVRHLDRQQMTQSIRIWLLQVAHITVMDYWLAVKRPPATLPDNLLAVDQKAPDEDDAPGTNTSSAERVQHILHQLPELDRAVLLYRFHLQYTVSEIAQIVGQTEANVLMLQYSALKRADRGGSLRLDHHLMGLE